MSTSGADVTVLVMAAPNRGIVAKRCRESIEASDIGTNYSWLEHPSGLTVKEHGRAVLEVARRAPTPLVMFFEDDAIVNRHILHNVRTWKEVDDARFGVGWLMCPGGGVLCRGPNIIDYIYHRPAKQSCWIRRPYLHISAGLLFRADVLPELLTRAYAWQDRNKKDPRPHTDLAVSHAVWLMGKHICVHLPSLIEHQIQDSKLGNHHHPRYDTSNGTFRREWRREDQI